MTPAIHFDPELRGSDHPTFSILPFLFRQLTINRQLSNGLQSTMDVFIGACILLASCVGHAEWWVLLVNRVHAFRIEHRRLRLLRWLHDIALPGYAVLLIWRSGFGENGLLTGSRFVSQPPSLQWLMILTSLGLVPLAAGVARWQFSQKHAFALSNRTERLDLTELAGPDPDVGRHCQRSCQRKSRLPGNQIFQLEVNHKTVRLPVRRLLQPDGATSAPGQTGPRSETSSVNPLDRIKPLRIVHLSDLHFRGCPGEGFYQRVVEEAAGMQPAAFAFTGDLIDEPELIPTAVRILSRLTEVAPCFFVLGNHDWRYDHAGVRKRLEDSGWTNLGGRTVRAELAGRQLQIAGTELPWLGTAPVLTDPATPPAAPQTDLRLLLSHSPDQIRWARSAGFDLVLAGHTHGGQVVLPMIGPVYAPSLHGVRFASGLFNLGPTTLHVSRGVGAQEPIRWKCCPEITCLHILFPRDPRDRAAGPP